MSLDISLCSPPDLADLQLPSDRPLRLLFLTSVRDVGECDRNGLMVYTGCRSFTALYEGWEYMEGVIERTVRETFPGGALDQQFEVVGVITDDRPKDLKDYPVLPAAGTYWLWRRNLCLPTGQRLAELTWNQPSDFRSLPRHNMTERLVAKRAFEEKVYAIMQQTGADLLVSDHYMARLEYLITAEFGLYGRVLNIHPAVTVQGHPRCFRGPTPTADAIARAVSDLTTVTGATLHLINSIIDDGPAIAYGVGTEVKANDQPQWLRWRNYQNAKLPLFIAGLRHYRSLVVDNP